MKIIAYPIHATLACVGLRDSHEGRSAQEVGAQCAEEATRGTSSIFLLLSLFFVLCFLYFLSLFSLLPHLLQNERASFFSLYLSLHLLNKTASEKGFPSLYLLCSLSSSILLPLLTTSPYTHYTCKTFLISHPSQSYLSYQICLMKYQRYHLKMNTTNRYRKVSPFIRLVANSLLNITYSDNLKLN